MIPLPNFGDHFGHKWWCISHTLKIHNCHRKCHRKFDVRSSLFISFIEWLFTLCEWSTLRVYLFTWICYHNTLFTFEYFFLQIRLACAPRKIQFFVAPMNLVDLFAIVPFFLDLIIGGLQVGLLQDQGAILLSLYKNLCFKIPKMFMFSKLNS